MFRKISKFEKFEPKAAHQTAWYRVWFVVDVGSEDREYFLDCDQERFNILQLEDNIVRNVPKKYLELISRYSDQVTSYSYREGQESMCEE